MNSAFLLEIISTKINPHSRAELSLYKWPKDTEVTLSFLPRVTSPNVVHQQLYLAAFHESQHAKHFLLCPIVLFKLDGGHLILGPTVHLSARGSLGEQDHQIPTVPCHLMDIYLNACCFSMPTLLRYPGDDRRPCQLEIICKYGSLNPLR